MKCAVCVVGRDLSVITSHTCICTPCITLPLASSHLLRHPLRDALFDSLGLAAACIPHVALLTRWLAATGPVTDPYAHPTSHAVAVLFNTIFLANKLSLHLSCWWSKLLLFVATNASWFSQTQPCLVYRCYPECKKCECTFSKRRVD